jgi:hypothetical protein
MISSFCSVRALNLVVKLRGKRARKQRISVKSALAWLVLAGLSPGYIFEAMHAWKAHDR